MFALFLFYKKKFFQYNEDAMGSGIQNGNFVIQQVMVDILKNKFFTSCMLMCHIQGSHKHPITYRLEKMENPFSS